MRTEQHIDLVLAKVKQLWLHGKKPFLRLGQLLCGVSEQQDVFFLEDEELLRRIDKFLAEEDEDGS